MKNNRLVRALSIVFAALVSISGIVSLVVDEVFKPFLDSMPEAKLIIILISVLSAYHVLASFTFNNIIKEEHTITNNMLQSLSEKNSYLSRLIPFSSLDEIERRHGRDNQNRTGNCEVWVISNVLQESSPKNRTDPDDLINTIYDNITKYRVHYYYVLPDTEKSKMEIESLSSCLRELHRKRKRRTITGGISYKYDSRYVDTITADYFDIVLYIDCDKNGNPCLHGVSTRCEGYQCFSNYSKENMYFYQRIDNNDKLFLIRKNHLVGEFEQLNIQK